jgi:hypothetical protein
MNKKSLYIKAVLKSFFFMFTGIVAANIIVWLIFEIKIRWVSIFGFSIVYSLLKGTEYIKK